MVILSNDATPTQMPDTANSLSDPMEDDASSVASSVDGSPVTGPIEPQNSILVEDSMARITLTPAALDIINISRTSTELSETCSSLVSSQSPLPEGLAGKVVVEFDPVMDIERLRAIWQPRSTALKTLVKHSNKACAKQFYSSPKDGISPEGGDDGDEFWCVCGSSEEDDLMVQCDDCMTWSHLWCYGYTSFEDPRIPESHICADCLVRRTGCVRSDESLDLANIRSAAIMRRSLVVAWLEGYTGSNDMCRRLGLVAWHRAHTLEENLISAGYLRQEKPMTKTRSASNIAWTVVKDPGTRAKLIGVLQPLRDVVMEELASGAHTVRGSERAALSSTTETTMTSSTAKANRTKISTKSPRTSSAIVACRGTHSSSDSAAFAATCARGKGKLFRPLSDITLQQGKEPSGAKTKRRKCSKEQVCVTVR
ncbi:hypothetical protein BC939DRAFT_320647 [Gamsiella multidivaricata]|uniref:uncharacterized protein n=1 Tax=Gamsiella multidivaricata TaxID=101098 RepID=UPI00221E56DB|nr:uncharacterized protein BC939DRAFT_320647 [Gamsiella multidivaricata]KAI7829755.1 hypothetical protein BC939DRAFT_320647 [Gamsiella multidivaricata]